MEFPYIPNLQPVNVVTDDDLFIICQDPNEINSVKAQTLKQYMSNTYTPAAPTIGQAGEVLTSNGSGGVFWSTIDGGVVTTRYQDLTYKPTINSVEFVGNMTSNDLALADEEHTHTVEDITDFPTLANVATTGSFDDLIDAPTIPDAVSFTQVVESGIEIGTLTIGEESYSIYTPDQEQTPPQYRIIGNSAMGDGYKNVKLQESSDGDTWTDVSLATIVPSLISSFTNDANYVSSSDLSAVASSGSYTDLSDTPTIPDAVSFEPTVLSGTKIGTITIGDTTTDIYSPIPEFDSPLYYGLVGDDACGSGYKTFNFLKSYDGNVWETQNSVSIPETSFSATYDSGIEIGTFTFGDESTTIYIPSGGGSVDICTVSLQSSEYGTIIGPTSVLKNTDVVYTAKPIEGFVFDSWVDADTSETISTNNPLVINISDDMTLEATYATNSCSFTLLTDAEQLGDSGMEFVPSYTINVDYEPSTEHTLCELLRNELFLSRENIIDLFSSGIEIESQLYQCVFNSGDNYDFFLDMVEYLPNIQDPSTVYLIYDSVDDNSIYHFNMYKWINPEDNDLDSNVFGFLYSNSAWIKIGTLTTSLSSFCDIIYKCTNAIQFGQDKLINMISLIGPTTFMLQT